jgi:hypothetical protein
MLQQRFNLEFSKHGNVPLPSLVGGKKGVQAPHADAVCAQELIERTNSISVSAETFKIGYISGNRKEDGQPDFKLPGLRIR